LVTAFSVPEQLALTGLNGNGPRLDSRSDALYGTHSYHTKVPPAAIARAIVEHAPAGGLVLDPFCGSGMTGVAAQQTGRLAFLNDLSPAAAHIAANYTEPCDPAAFRAGVDRVLARCGEQVEAMYASRDADTPARVEYVVWSDVRRCPACGAEIVLWKVRVTGLRTLICPRCSHRGRKIDYPVMGERAVETSLSGVQGGRVTRPAREQDLGQDAIPGVLPWHPTLPFGPDRPMWRRGHEDLGIRTVADSRRVGSAWSTDR
jgi:hypothetical protein